MKTRNGAMNVQECFRILRLNKGANLDEVKSAYRQLAFKYHPDLNSSPGAANKFREINEAYVIIKDTLAAGPQKAEYKAPPKGEKPKAKPKQGAHEYAKQQSRARQDAKAHYKESTRARSQKFYYKEEEVLQDLLNDPFARKVFEDIYSQIRKKNPNYKGPVGLKERKLSLQWGDKKLHFDLTKGVTGSIKSWLKGTMDYEQTVYFPGHTLMPGRKVRITVEQKFSKGPKTIEVILPQDFVIGRPIRLKGLGRRLGPLKGDLLLRILPK